MNQRFEYDRLTGAQFSAGLDLIEMDQYTFARLFGVSATRVIDWLNDHPKHPIPFWVRQAIELLADHPGNIVVARCVAADGIRRDLRNPDLGEYPFLGGADV